MTDDAQTLVHLCGARDWSEAQRGGRVDPDPEVGFVHLSTPQQVHLPANRFYRGRDDVLLLHIAADRVDAPLRWEPGTDSDPDGMTFPHLYGPLPVAAVVAVTEYRPDADGVFGAISR
ncbi:DUF952 domain-containing protein [Mycobacterium sp. M1]|uniref:DUF952 domain-containing protein n=1 Tax=Mycolicibacter acidiphilus TaxID=2835306 RepID=A0ABS5RCL0_9MYCO|nr:DUF952 domain-containing protein [Mycolicibacter acidiphilus]MBS9532023.1 DUF952 domain-containing protein [Mycolicibacter acidiphilus]